MLRISQEDRTPGQRVLRLEGRLIGAWVEELRTLCEQALEGGGSLVLEMEQVAYADRKGVALLKDLAERHVSFSNCPPYLETQIESP